jgi:acyl-CoA thioester hydrolase
MARQRLTLPTTHLFTTKIDVRITDINYGNHVGNDAFVGILHEARVKWLKHFGYTELHIEKNIGLIMSTLCINFKSESYYGDCITINLFVGDISSAGFELYYQLKTVRNETEIELAVAKTEMVCYNYTTKKVESIPTSFTKILA